MGIFSKKTGWNCRPSEENNGQVTCTRFEAKKDQRVATGTEITMGTNPDTCEVFFTGSANAMLDDDDSAIQEIANKLATSCKKQKGGA